MQVSPVARKFPPRAVNAEDAAIGGRLRAARVLAGLSQTVLGGRVGISFQQIQKYEKGHNRIGGSRLQQFAEILNVQPGYFFTATATDAAALPAESFANRREAIEMMQLFGGIQDPAARRALRTIAAALVGIKLEPQPIAVVTEARAALPPTIDLEAA
ncbi:helix-turn-helix domain-containing protein [Ferrovibrio sp.]|uniref:helix-turn-helix domain-containing protein n=1 Tax=Ferrovibrio sp. TaxID=1917215 RepID=UPI003D0E81CD